MEKIVVYQAADGKRFDSEADAKRHENLSKAHNDAYEQYACYGKYEFHSDEEFGEFVCKYADMIRGDQ